MSPNVANKICSASFPNLLLQFSYKQRPQRTDGGGPDSGDRAAALAENPVSPVWRSLGKSGHSTALQSRKKRKKKTPNEMKKY